MGQLSTDLGAFATGHKLLHKDKEYEFHCLSLFDLAEFEKENYRMRKDALHELREDYGQAEYVKRLDEVRTSYQNNEFSLQNNPEYLQKVEGIALLLRIMLREASPQDIVLLLRERFKDVFNMVNLVIEESLGSMRMTKEDGSIQDPPS